MIRAVTVDWWHTLAEPHGGDWEAYAKRMRIEGVRDVLAARGISCTLERLDLAYDLWTDHLIREWRRNVDWSGDQQLLDLLHSAGFDGLADRSLVADLREPIGSPLLARVPAIHEGAADALRSLRARGLKIALISNTGRTWGHFLRLVQDRVGLSGLFDERTFSDEARVRKPARPIFERTLAALRVRPEEAVHVGDDVDADVGGAKAVGMRAVWYDTGKWKDADGSRADAVIHAWRELPDRIAGW